MQNYNKNEDYMLGETIELKDKTQFVYVGKSKDPKIICVRDEAALIRTVSLDDVTTPKWSHYNPEFGDSRICDCGHTYDRHFDSYEDMSPVGCKYCECDSWREPNAENDKKILRGFISVFETFPEKFKYSDLITDWQEWTKDNLDSYYHYSESINRVLKPLVGVEHPNQVWSKMEELGKKAALEKLLRVRVSV